MILAAIHYRTHQFEHNGVNGLNSRLYTLSNYGPFGHTFSLIKLDKSGSQIDKRIIYSSCIVNAEQGEGLIPGYITQTHFPAIFIPLDKVQLTKQSGSGIICSIRTTTNQANGRLYRINPAQVHGSTVSEMDRLINTKILVFMNSLNIF